jgi:arginine-tRNA-protein transferase
MTAGPHTFSHYPALPLPQADLPPVVTAPPHPCGYLPGRSSTLRAFEADRLPAATYQRLMDAGFRRSGHFVYQSVCAGCRRCVPLRVPTAAFTPSKSQRRVMRKNADLVVRVSAPAPSTEKWALYDRYQRQWHEGTQASDPASFLEFLYQSPVDTAEFEYRTPAGRLVGVGLCDLTPAALSSVYFYFDPDLAPRSPGTFSALYEIAWAKEMGLTYWYAGLWIDGCRTMAYKIRFQPAELLDTDGIWRPAPPPAADPAD